MDAELSARIAANLARLGGKSTLEVAQAFEAEQDPAAQKAEAKLRNSIKAAAGSDKDETNGDD